MSITYPQKALPTLETASVDLRASADDSPIDSKQKRKRKLEKPLKIQKKLNTTVTSSEPNLMKSFVSKFGLKFEENANLPMDCKSNYEFSEKSDNNKQKNTTCRRMKNFDASSTPNVSYNKAFENKNLIRTSKLFVQPCQKQNILTRIRRNSDCCSRAARKVPKVRRKSCGNFSYWIQEPITCCYDPNDAIAFNEVEIQLEKMFAGIIEGDTNVSKTKGMNIDNFAHFDKRIRLKNRTAGIDVASISCEAINSNRNETSLSDMKLDKKKTKSTKKYLDVLSEPANKNSKKRRSYAKSLKSKNNMNNKRKKKVDYLRDAFLETYSCNQAKNKGPIIQMKNFNINSNHSEIVNFPREDDEEKSKEKRRYLLNGVLGKSKRLNHHQSNIDYRGESFFSMLNNNYYKK